MLMTATPAQDGAFFPIPKRQLYALYGIGPCDFDLIEICGVGIDGPVKRIVMICFNVVTLHGSLLYPINW